MRKRLDIPYNAGDMMICFIWADDYQIAMKAPILTIGCDDLNYLIQLQRDATNFGDGSTPIFYYDDKDRIYRLRADARIIDMLPNEPIDSEAMTMLWDFLNDIEFPKKDSSLG